MHLNFADLEKKNGFLRRIRQVLGEINIAEVRHEDMSRVMMIGGGEITSY